MPTTRNMMPSEALRTTSILNMGGLPGSPHHMPSATGAARSLSDRGRERVQEHGGGRRDAERVDRGGDRDGDLEIRGGADVRRQTLALVADAQDEAPGAAHGRDGAGARTDGGGPHGAAAAAEMGEGGGEVVG